MRLDPEQQKPPNTPNSERERSTAAAAMFYSQCLVSKKGPLGAIWVAGCCFKRLKKTQVTDTNISSSVDKILGEGLPSVTYRILALLLLGVVRIYSRKVEYLFQDCHEIVCDINKFSVGKKTKTVPFKNIVRSSYSIILPERYELDAFQLEGGDGGSGSEISQMEDITHQEARKDTFTQDSADKLRFEEMEGVCRGYEQTQSSAGVAVQHQNCSSSQTPEKHTATQETSFAAYTPPDKVLSPRQMETDMEVDSPVTKQHQTSKDRLGELRFTEEMCMDADIICDFDVELLNLVNEYQTQKDNEGIRDTLEKAPVENCDNVVLDKVVPSSKEKTSDLETSANAQQNPPVEKDDLIVQDQNEVLDARGIISQELLVVRTPAKIERAQRRGKRKCIFDEATVFDNEFMKQTINDASGLVCKRRKAPHTVIDLWRFYLIPKLSKNFSEPLILCAALELKHVQPSAKVARPEPSLNVVTEPVVQTTETCGKVPDVMTPSGSRSTLAPGTPVRCPTSARVFASARGGDSDGEGPVYSYDNARNEFSMHEEENGPTILSEMDADEGDSQEQKSKNGMSTRTRTVAKYLHQTLNKKKQLGEETVGLLPILNRKSRKESARFFYEILVLTTGGFVNVKQENAYDDVVLKETAKMEETLVEEC